MPLTLSANESTRARAPGRPSPASPAGAGRTHALPCTLAVCLGLAGGKWAAHIAIPGTPVYLTDLLLALGVLAFVRGMLTGPSLRRNSRRVHPGLVLTAFVVWVGIRLVTSQWEGITSLRDAAPYMYLIVSFVSAASYSRATLDQLAKTRKWLVGALLAHLAWCLPGGYILGNGETVGPHPLETTWFQPRNDFDLGILGMLLAYALFNIIRGHRPKLWILCVVATLAAMVPLTSRAGLLAVMFACGFVVWRSLVSRTISANRRIILALSIPLLLVAVMLGLSLTSSGDRLIAGLGGGARTSAATGASGTVDARKITWKAVIRYTGEDATRQWVGVGFGPDFLWDSGATLVIAGNEWQDVRSPHNWFVGTYARLGTIGIILAILLVLLIGLSMYRVRELAVREELVLLAVLACGVVVIMACFGVILESPFGAVPFGWSAGLLLSKPDPEANPEIDARNSRE